MSAHHQLIDWLQSLPGFVDQLHRHQFTGDIVTADRLSSRCEEYLSLLLCIQQRVDGEVCQVSDANSVVELSSDVQELVEIIHHYHEHYQDWVLQLLDENIDDNPSPSRILQGTPGRPRYDVPKSQIEALMELGFSYTTMARMLNVSPRTIRRCQEEYGLPVGCQYSDISDNNLDEVVGTILQV